MSAIICYDTKYGSTTDVCNYIKLGIKMSTDVKKISEEILLNSYDLIVLGSPIYIGKPMKSVQDFILANYDKLRNKKIAIFVTCWAMATQYAASSSEFLEQLKKVLPPCNLICQAALPGKLLLDKISVQDRNLMRRLLRRLDEMIEEFESQNIAWRDARDKMLAINFGKEIQANFNK